MNPFAMIWDIIISILKWIFGIKEKTNSKIVNGYHTESYVLSNGLKILIVHKEDFNNTVFTLDIITGQLNDPKDMPGLSDLVYRMIFDDSNILSANSNNSQAKNQISFIYSPAEERSRYFAWSRNEYLEKLFENLTKNLLNPILTQQAIEKHLKILREEQASKDFSKIENPKEFINQVNDIIFYSGIYNSNLEQQGSISLENEIFESNIETLAKVSNLKNAVGRFYSEYYKADKMNLTICSSLPVYEVKKIINKLKRIPSSINAKLPLTLQKSLKIELPSNFSGKLVKIFCEKKPNVLTLNILLPPLYQLFQHGFGRLNLLSLFIYINGGRKFKEMDKFILNNNLDVLYRHQFTHLVISIQLSPEGLENIGKVLSFIDFAISNLSYDIKLMKMCASSGFQIAPPSNMEISDVLTFYNELPFSKNYDVNIDYSKLDLKSIHDRAKNIKNWFMTLSTDNKNLPYRSQISKFQFSDPISIKDMMPREEYEPELN